MLRVGITERGDAGINQLWVRKMPKVEAAILITKEVSNEFIENVLRYKNKVIVHISITGMGGTKIEPCVPSLNWNYKQVQKLIHSGFPREQLVLRLDPVVPTDKGILTAVKVLDKFKDTGIERCRFSFIDMYKHVQQRFLNTGIKLPFSGFTAPIEMRSKFLRVLRDYEGIFKFESCGENTEYKRGCISDLDMKILRKDVALVGSTQQRKFCLCPTNKIDLLNSKHRCAHQCLYCYWYDYAPTER